MNLQWLFHGLRTGNKFKKYKKKIVTIKSKYVTLVWFLNLNKELC